MSLSANILIIDDEESLREGCRQVLIGEGYRVKTAENGNSGLEMNNRESFDVILLDFKMPGISGMEVLKTINQSGAPHPLVIVITAYGTIEIAVEAMRQGAYNFLTKPFTPEELIRAVKDAVASRRRILKKVHVVPPLNLSSGPDAIIGRSSEILNIVRLARQSC